MKKPLVEMPGDDFANMDVRAAYVVRFGPRCAGYLVSRQQFRKQVRRTGFFSIHLETKEEEPPWLQIAIEYLTKHAKRWDVVTTTQRGVRRWRVRWLGGRQIPASIVPLGTC